MMSVDNLRNIEKISVRVGEDWKPAEFTAAFRHVAGMMITSEYVAHQSTRNTVSCMAQGQAAGTAAALCAAQNCMTRDLKYSALRNALVQGGVYLVS